MIMIEQDFTLPFSGFYESHHMESLQEEVSRIVEDPETGESASREAIYRAANLIYDCINWPGVLNGYAIRYASRVGDLIDSAMGRKGVGDYLKFVALTRPREYNFMTDSISCTLPLAVFKVMYSRTKNEVFNDIIRGRLARRSGFAPFHPNNLREWRDRIEESFKANRPINSVEASLIFDAFLLSEGEHNSGDLLSEFLDLHMMGDDSRDGFLGDLIWQNLGGRGLQIARALPRYYRLLNAPAGGES